MEPGAGGGRRAREEKRSAARCGAGSSCGERDGGSREASEESVRAVRACRPHSTAGGPALGGAAETAAPALIIDAGHRRRRREARVFTASVGIIGLLLSGSGSAAVSMATGNLSAADDDR